MHPMSKEIKYIIDPKEVSKKDDLRVRSWGLSVINKYEHFLDDKLPERRIVYRKEVEPEDIDVKNIYPFPDLHWFIHREGQFWCLTLCYKNPKHKNDVILAKLTYAKI